jgi:Lrp/AsnC family leucine-responsive transcriptional regulator
VEEIDRAIVGALTTDGRLSYTDLAERVGLSVSAVHQRVRRLEQRGVISGYTAKVSYEALELPLTAFVAIRPFDPSQPDDAPERLAHLPEIDDRSRYDVPLSGLDEMDTVVAARQRLGSAE